MRLGRGVWLTAGVAKSAIKEIATRSVDRWRKYMVYLEAWEIREVTPGGVWDSGCVEGE